jgi:hypothetical protein
MNDGSPPTGFWDFLVKKGDDVLTFITLGALSLQQSGLIDDPRVVKWVAWSASLAAIAHKVFFPAVKTA